MANPKKEKKENNGGASFLHVASEKAVNRGVNEKSQTWGTKQKAGILARIV